MASRTLTQSGPTAALHPAFSKGGLAGVLLLLGLVIRLWFAHSFFLNPDEALHYLLSLQPNFRMTYEATLPTSHPPLYIVFLHYWGYLVRSEFFLRLPSVLTATAFCWLLYRWMKVVATESAALIGLTLLLFSPALIYVSTELRQYAFVLCFSAAALYFLELGLTRESTPCIAASGAALCLGLLTHYSAMLVALTLGIYALWRFISDRKGLGLLVAWSATQLLALGIAITLFVTQIVQLKARGRFEMAAETYLRRSSFHPGEEHAISFVARATIRLFQYFFSQGAVGVAALALFIAGVVLLLRDRRESPRPRQLAVFAMLPLVVNCLLGLKDIYPYGGTRHSSYLAIFIFPVIAIVLDRWKPVRAWIKAAVIGAVLLLCNFFPSPTGEYIRHSDQSRKRMLAAVSYLSGKTAQPGSLIMTDNQGGLLLSYYMCGGNVVPLDAVAGHFSKAQCGSSQVFSLDPRQWIFRGRTFPGDMTTLKNDFNLRSGQRIWLFQAGWLVDNEAEFRAMLSRYGCPATQDFGRNILVCDITVP